MLLKDFDYALPKELIAQEPAGRRDASRLMVLDRGQGTIEHKLFHQLPDYLEPSDLLIANNTRVIPARLYGTKETGGWVELFLLTFQNQDERGQVWECLLKSRRKVVEAARLSFGQSLQAEVLQPLPGGKWQVRLECPGSFEAALQEAGSTPLPPYIRRGRGDQRDESDRRRYQTVYARCDGAVAAPTAGLHFTPELMERVQGMGASFSFVTLHVGYGTFQPIRQEVVEEHAMHYEFYQVDGSCADAVNGARTSSGRVIAVGTTATRVLETVASSDGRLAPAEGSTDLYVYPGYRFKAVDAMITNFHLPMSSLLLLVSAFAGREFVLQAYREAIEHKYRFFSYGDAMLIL